MDKIFQEIKKAIEEEMRNAESGPPPGGGRSQAGGGRRAQEYAEWLKQEQDRLRGDGGQPAARPAPIEDVQMEMPAQPEPRRERQQSQGSSRQRSEGSSRQDHENRAAQRRQQQQQRQQPRQQASRRERRYERDAYQLRTASDMSRQIKRLLRSKNGLRQAFLMREIISKPVSLRDKDDHLIS
jgi:hypothetical protein